MRISSTTAALLAAGIALAGCDAPKPIPADGPAQSQAKKPVQSPNEAVVHVPGMV